MPSIDIFDGAKHLSVLIIYKSQTKGACHFGFMACGDRPENLLQRI